MQKNEFAYALTDNRLETFLQRLGGDVSQRDIAIIRNANQYAFEPFGDVGHAQKLVIALLCYLYNAHVEDMNR